jgi:hypothetical protein
VATVTLQGGPADGRIFAVEERNDRVSVQSYVEGFVGTAIYKVKGNVAIYDHTRPFIDGRGK